MKNYLQAKGGDPNVAFAPEGIMEMNQNISFYNDGKQHQPIRKVRLFEPMGTKYPVGQSGNKSVKYVEAQNYNIGDTFIITYNEDTKTFKIIECFKFIAAM